MAAICRALQPAVEAVHFRDYNLNFHVHETSDEFAPLFSDPRSERRSYFKKLTIVPFPQVQLGDPMIDQSGIIPKPLPWNDSFQAHWGVLVTKEIDEDLERAWKMLR